MTAHKEGDPTTLNRLYGRSSGHKLRKGQSELVETLLPSIAVPEEGEITSQRLFGDDRPLHLEIGFGGGEHLAYRADMLPCVVSAVKSGATLPIESVIDRPFLSESFDGRPYKPSLRVMRMRVR